MGVQRINFSGVPVASIAWNSGSSAENTTCELFVSDMRNADDLNRLITELNHHGFDLKVLWSTADQACLELSRGRGEKLIDYGAVKGIVEAATAVSMFAQY